MMQRKRKRLNYRKLVKEGKKWKQLKAKKRERETLSYKSTELLAIKKKSWIYLNFYEIMFFRKETK